MWHYYPGATELVPFHAQLRSKKQARFPVPEGTVIQCKAPQIVSDERVKEVVSDSEEDDADDFLQKPTFAGGDDEDTEVDEPTIAIISDDDVVTQDDDANGDTISNMTASTPMSDVSDEEEPDEDDDLNTTSDVQQFIHSVNTCGSGTASRW